MSKENKETVIESVQIEGVVVLKIVKHCHEEGAGEIAKGVLLGLLVDKTLEITNCFPSPKAEDEEINDIHYQIDMLRKLRDVNVDHFQVGWYQSAFLGSFVNRNFVESQFRHQKSSEESVVIVYDPLLTNQGMMSFKAYRLTPKLMSLYESGELNFTPKGMSKAGIEYTDLIEEYPVTLKTSNLMNALIAEMEFISPPAVKEDFLSLATGSYLEKNIHLLIEGTDGLCQDAQKLHNHQRDVARQQQHIDNYKQKRAADNESRKLRGEPPLPEEDINKLYRPQQPPLRLDNMLTTAQIGTYCDHLGEYATQSFGKFFIAENVQKSEC